ncbi:BLUF domain-containing protein [Tranquillimonas alkanivorans]|uniref:Sensors of blue-light using FAD n=1 Tax=Tranquillimonas alkanivorans TaxID=441119 RepID=A0A1I5QST6_9RHOB|nr:BLUF domain-containing protein [Tranquillimonas alkanivorans]SFP49302.1 Sensors of blue-light using FAD [Tranquillimonas alkanivorans]
MIHQVFYVSTATEEQSAADIDALLEVSRRNNRRDGITGLLIYHDRMFLQVLEGPKDAVRACFARIERDPRHREAWIVSEGEAAARGFPDWQMGFASPEDLNAESQRSVRSLMSLRRGEDDSLGTDPAVQGLLQNILPALRG